MKTSRKTTVHKSKQHGIPADWKNLVTKLYLLRPIHTRGDYNRAVGIVDMLAGRTDLNRDQADYLESLSTLIEAYEEKELRIRSRRNPIGTLKFLVESNGMTGSDLGHILGHRQLGAKILDGKRQLSKAHIRKLADYFRVEAGLFV